MKAGFEQLICQKSGPLHKMRQPDKEGGVGGGGY